MGAHEFSESDTPTTPKADKTHETAPDAAKAGDVDDVSEGDAPTTPKTDKAHEAASTTPDSAKNDGAGDFSKGDAPATPKTDKTHETAPDATKAGGVGDVSEGDVTTTPHANKTHKAAPRPPPGPPARAAAKPAMNASILPYESNLANWDVAQTLGVAVVTGFRAELQAHFGAKKSNIEHVYNIIDADLGCEILMHPYQHKTITGKHYLHALATKFECKAVDCFKAYEDAVENSKKPSTRTGRFVRGAVNAARVALSPVVALANGVVALVTSPNKEEKKKKKKPKSKARRPKAKKAATTRRSQAAAKKAAATSKEKSSRTSTRAGQKGPSKEKKGGKRNPSKPTTKAAAEEEQKREEEEEQRAANVGGNVAVIRQSFVDASKPLRLHVTARYCNMEQDAKSKFWPVSLKQYLSNHDAEKFDLHVIYGISSTFHPLSPFPCMRDHSFLRR